MEKGNLLAALAGPAFWTIGLAGISKAVLLPSQGGTLLLEWFLDPFQGTQPISYYIIAIYIYVYIYIFEYCFQFSMKSPTSNKIDVGGVQLKYPQVSANLETKLICHSTCVTTQNPRPLFCLHASNSKALWTVSRVDWPAYVSRWVQLWDETPE